MDRREFLQGSIAAAATAVAPALPVAEPALPYMLETYAGGFTLTAHVWKFASKPLVALRSDDGRLRVVSLTNDAD